MQANNNQEALEQHFADAKKSSSRLETGEGQEAAMLKKETERFIRESAAFEKSKSNTQKFLVKCSIAVAVVATLVSLALAFALAALAPLKTVKPYVITVNTDNANVSVSDPLEKPVVTQGEVVDKFFISEYIRAREGYDWGLAQRMYDTVKAYSVLNASVFNEYDLFIKSTKSPLVILADRSRVVVNISSITLDQKTSSATVRFSKMVMGADGRPSPLMPTTYWIATLRYEYPNPELKASERVLNPLGMQIPSYQLVQENRGQ